jgi:diguanylate cyclase (GGDEF)-like protein/PAS domain S-box-containing protein
MKDARERREDAAIRVLVVEDNPGDARLVSLLLAADSDVSFHVTEVSSLAQAVALSSNCVFDVVLTDLGLPDSFGLETVDAILAAWPRTPVVVLTAESDRRVGVMAVVRGCQDYLVKGAADAALMQRTLRYAIERNAAARALQESEERFRILVDLSPDAILLCTKNEILFANARALETFHASRQEDLLGADPAILFCPNDHQRLLSAFTMQRMHGDSHGTQRIECRLFRLDGTSFDGEVYLAVLDHQECPAAEMVIRVISEKNLAERHQHLASIVFMTTDEAMMVTDESNRIIAVNPAFERVTGYAAMDVMGYNPRILASGRHNLSFYQEMWQKLEQTGHWHGEVWNRRKNGEIYVQRLTLSLIRDAAGKILNHVGIFSDITDEKQEAERIRYRASFDALTGLPNRSLLHDRLSQALVKTARRNGLLGVLFLDLDGFKPVNDGFGHLAGDHLLVALAKRLQGCVRESDTVARLGGDEFVVLLPDMASPADAQLVAAKILSALAAPFSIAVKNTSVRIGVSIGIAIYPMHGETVEELVNAADRAMYDAKLAGKGRFLFAGEAGA